MAEVPDYPSLADYLAAHADVVGAGLDDISGLSPLAAEVKVTAVQSLLLGRAPGVLDSTDPERFVMFIEALNGVATEVEAIAGTGPSTPVRDLAVWAITVGVAAQIEASLFPEQQLGGTDSTASQLQIRYLAMLKRLESLPGVGTATGALGVVGPLGSFPEASTYPDPARQPTDSRFGRFGWSQ